jgi:phospholipase/carboxylesterase
MNSSTYKNDPHDGAKIYTAGEPLPGARAAMIFIHGRGASAHDILSLSAELRGNGYAYIAPQAANHTWYPNRFNMPTNSNEPWLTSALNTVDRAVSLAAENGIPTDRTILLGFSQGACLVLEFAARNPRRYGGVIGLSGGVIGADDEPRYDEGSLEGTPVFLGCSDGDFHIPEYRVHQAAAVFSGLGAQVETRIYPGLGHTINQDELSAVQAIMDHLISDQPGS